MAFPISPVDGQIYKEYVYNTTISTWNKVDPGKYFDIGFTYTQLPGESSPADKGWYGTWSNISSSFAGDFFRVEGGNAETFNGGEQDFAIQSHNHTIVTGAGNETSGVNMIDEEQVYGSVTPTEYTGSTGGDETRPVNQTIRVWKRTA